MAQELSDNSPSEKTHEAKIALAVRAMQSDPSVRYLLRLHLRSLSCMPQSGVFSTDPLQNAFDQGKQAAGLELVSILTQVDAMFWPALQIEEFNDEKLLATIAEKRSDRG